MTNLIFNIISAAIALGYTSIYLASLAIFPVLLQAVFGALSLITMFVVYRGGMNKLSETISESGWLSLMFFFTLSSIVSLSMFFEFSGVLLSSFPPGLVFSYLAKGISVVASIGSSSLMAANGLELINQNRQKTPYWKLVMVVAFYACVVVSALQPFGHLFLLQIPEKVAIYLLPMLTISLVYFTQHDFLVGTFSEFSRLWYNPIVAISLLLARLMDRVFKLLISSFHFVAESFLPAAGLMRWNQTIGGVAPKFQALSLIMVLTLAEVMQDYQVIFKDGEQKYVQSTRWPQWVTSILLICATASTLFYSWYMVLLVTLIIRFSLTKLFGESSFASDVSFLSQKMAYIKGCIGYRTIPIAIVCAVAGYAAAVEMQILLPFSAVFLMMFAVSGIWIETGVYEEAWNEFDSIPSSQAKPQKELPEQHSPSLISDSSLVGVVKHLFSIE